MNLISMEKINKRFIYFICLVSAIGGLLFGTFWIYAAICALGFIFFSTRLPETKGKSLEQLQKELVNDETQRI